MKLTSIPQLYRNFNRALEVLSVLSKYGLADWFSRLDLDFAKSLLKSPDGEELARLATPTRIRLAIAELGPTFIKLGQILSTRPDVVGVEIADELQKLQADAPADALEAVQKTIEEDVGKPLSELFGVFDAQPLASASIGQVHAARLPDGRAVVVKVQHPGIRKKIHVDLEILTGLAQLAERAPELQPYRPRDTIAEFQRTLERELDFGREERHLQHFARCFAGDERIRIPRSYPELCTPRVLTMERLDGIKLSDSERLRAEGVDLKAVARHGADLYMEMVFKHGSYHADPHPGNMLLLPGDVIGLLDFGMIGRLDDALVEDIGDMLLAVASGDANELATIITRVGEVPSDLDHAALGMDVAEFVAYYTAQRLDQFDLSGALNELTEIIRRYRIMLPARVALLIKVLVMLEGTSKLLNPQFNLMDVIRPYQRVMLRRRLSPRRQLRKARSWFREMERLMQVLPRGIGEILRQVQSGNFDVHLDHRGLETSVNRLVLGMLTSALFLGSALLLSRDVPPVLPLWGGVSIPGAAGGIVSVALAVRLLRAINKSGHLDRRD